LSEDDKECGGAVVGVVGRRRPQEQQHCRSNQRNDQDIRMLLPGIFLMIVV
jgi:hypothetical protein